MTKFLISFPSGVMLVADGEWDQVVEESHQIVRDMKRAGAYVFGGGINEDVEPVAVAADGTVNCPSSCTTLSRSYSTSLRLPACALPQVLPSRSPSR